MAVPPTTKPGKSQNPDPILHVGRRGAAASLAGGIIAASGRAYSVQEAVALAEDVFHAMFPAPGKPVFDQWKSDATRLTKVRK